MQSNNKNIQIKTFKENRDFYNNLQRNENKKVFQYFCRQIFENAGKVEQYDENDIDIDTLPKLPPIDISDEQIIKYIRESGQCDTLMQILDDEEFYRTIPRRKIDITCLSELDIIQKRYEKDLLIEGQDDVLSKSLLKWSLQQNKECPICLLPTREFTLQVHKGDCPHTIHRHCYAKMQKNECPLCRIPYKIDKRMYYR